MKQAIGAGRASMKTTRARPKYALDTDLTILGLDNQERWWRVSPCSPGGSQCSAEPNYRLPGELSLNSNDES